MRVSLPALRCLDDESNRRRNLSASQAERQYVFIFTPPRCGPHQIGIQFPRYDRWGRPILKPLIVDVARQPADRVLAASC